LWLTQGWEKRFRPPILPARDTGYGHTATKVGKVRVESAGQLTGYYDAVHEQTLEYLRGLTAKGLQRIVDERWDPPVTLGVRLSQRPVRRSPTRRTGRVVRGLLQSAEA